MNTHIEIKNSTTILAEAENIIYGDREKTYGHPAKNLDLIANYWSAHLNSKFGINIILTFHDVCGMMILLKQARMANTPGHRDSGVDICGYAALEQRCIEADNVVSAPAAPAVKQPEVN